MAYRWSVMVLVAVALTACGGGVGTPSLPTEAPGRTATHAAAPPPTPHPTEAAHPWPIGLTRAQVAAVLTKLGYEPLDAPDVPAGTFVASSGSNVLATATITGSEERVTGIDTAFHAGGGDQLTGLFPFFVSGVSGAEVDRFLEVQARRFENTGESASAQLQVPGAIVSWTVSQQPNEAGGLSISVAER